MDSLSWIPVLTLCLGLVLSAPAAAGEPPVVDDSRETAAIAKVIDDSIAWFETKDFDRLFDSFADDAEFFIFHPDSKSTVRGIGAFREHSRLFENPDLTYAGHEVRDLRINRSRGGETAWFSALLRDCWNYRGEEGCWEDCRWTGVLEKRGDRWLIVQMHFSFAEDQVLEAHREGDEDRDAKIFGTYAEMRGVVVELFGEQRYAEAAAILAGAVARYPDHVMANTFNLALMYASLGNGDEAARALEEGYRRGVFYSKWGFQGAPWDTHADCAALQSAVARNADLLAKAQEAAVMRLEVAPPTGYAPEKSYPLFIALHGGGENLEQFRPQWTSPRLRDEFIVVYVQSSQVAAMDGYHWQDDAVTRRELDTAYRDVIASYSVDTNRVLVGGFSSGGYGTLVTTFEETVPAKGFVILCPEVPVDPGPEAVAGAVRRGVRGTLLTTERDGRIERQREYVTSLSGQGLDVRIVVTPDLGHWYPENLGELIDEALDHIDLKR